MALGVCPDVSPLAMVTRRAGLKAGSGRGAAPVFHSPLCESAGEDG